MGVPIRRVMEMMSDASNKNKAIKESGMYSNLVSGTVYEDASRELYLFTTETDKAKCEVKLKAYLSEVFGADLDDDNFESMLPEFTSYALKGVNLDTLKVKESAVTESMEEESTLQGYVDDNSDRILLFPGSMGNAEVVSELEGYLRESGDVSEDELTSEANRITDTYYDVYQYEK